MSVNNPTTNYGWVLPTEGGSDDTWGTELNEMMAEAAGAAIESIDTVLAGLQLELDAEQLRITDADERTLQLEGSAPRPAYARVWLGTDQTYTKNTAANVTTWTEDFDKNDMFDTANPSRLTIPATFDGLFTIRGAIRVPMSSGQSDDSPIWYARITKNVGATVMAEVRTPFLNAGYNDDGTIGDQTLIVECLVDAVGGDYFELEVFYNVPSSGSGAATLELVGGVQNTYFEAYRHRSPTIGAQAAASGFMYSTNSSTTTHTINLPVEDRTAGQMLLVIFSPRANVTSTTPSGFTEIFDSGADPVAEVQVWMKRITTSEAGGGSIGSTTSLGRESVAVAVLLNDAHATSDPEVGGGDEGSGDFDGTLSVTPSWGTDLTLYLVVPVWGGPSVGDYDAVPSGWTGTDELPSDPDENLSGTISGSIGNSLSYKAGAGAATTVPDHTFDPNIGGYGVVIAVRGAQLN